MNWLRSLKQLLWGNHLRPSRSRPARLRCTPTLECLESRLVPYANTGNAWPIPQLITISFVPDGTVLATNGTQQVGSNLFSTFNSNARLNGQWQNIILKAAQTWAQQTNINFTVVPDNGAPEGSGNDQEGNPGFGDIRIGGYNFGNSVVALTTYPPQANNYSIAGDVDFNTGQPFNVGSTYDLFTVATHEIGHALGLGESSVAAAVEYANYNGVKSSLASDDIAGIRNIYSNNNPRTPDAFDSAATPNTSFSAAANINSYINSTALTAVLPSLDMTTTSEVEYFTFTAPASTSGTLSVDVQSSGLSLLAPKFTVYAANQQTVLGSATALGNYTGATLSVSVTGVTAGEQFYVKVSGTDSTAFSTGAYALTFSFGNNAAPTVHSPNTTVPNGNPEQGGGGYAQNSGTTVVYLDSVPVITEISPDTGASNSDGVTNSPRISFSGVAPVLSSVELFEVQRNANGTIGQPLLIGSTLAVTNWWTINYTNHSFAEGTYTFYAEAAPLLGLTALLGLGSYSSPSTTYNVTIDTVAPPSPGISGYTTNGDTPTLLGTAQADTTVQIYSNGQSIGSTTVGSNGSWSFTTSALANGTYSFTARAVDLAGNVSGSSTALQMTINNGSTLQPAAPQLAASGILIANSDDSLNTIATPTFTGTAPAGTVVTIVSGNTILGTAVANAAGIWSFTSAPLASGTYSITIFETDAQGISSPLSAPLTIDI